MAVLSDTEVCFRGLVGVSVVLLPLLQPGRVCGYVQLGVLKFCDGDCLLLQKGCCRVCKR
jgi:hypothetical protein